jgi:hypothetical protein
MRRGGWGADIDGPGWTVVNRPQLQQWVVPYTVLFGVLLLAGVHDFLTSPVNSGNWQGSLFLMPFACTCYVLIWLLLWRGLATFAFGPDRILVRTWLGIARGRPPRFIALTPDLKIVFQLVWGLTIRSSTEQLVTNAQYFPPSQLRRLIAIAEERGIPIEYQWKPDFMTDQPRKPRWQRWLGL